MAKLITITCLSLFMSLNVHAKKVTVTIITPTDTIKGHIDLTWGKFTDINELGVIQKKLVYTDSTGNKIKMFPSDVNEFLFTVKNEEYRFISCFGKIKKIQSKDKYYFLRLDQEFNDGKIKLFTCLLEKSTGSINTSYSGSETTEIHIIQLENGRLIRGDTKEFRMVMSKYYGYNQ